MSMTLVKAYTLAPFSSLAPGSLFVQPEADNLLTGLKPYRQLAKTAGAQLVKFDDTSAYEFPGDRMNPDRLLSFCHFRPNQIVLAGPSIASLDDIGGVLEPAGLAVLRTLRQRPGLQMPLAEYYPELKIGRLRLLPHPEYARAHHLLGELVTHQTVVITADSMLRLTLIGLSRALQLELR